MPLPLIITRPVEQARAWQRLLQPHLGNRACHVLPLIEIAPVTRPQQLQHLRQCWQMLERYHAAVFVSPAAVRHFFAAHLSEGAAARLWHAHALRAWAVGPGTRQALLHAGVRQGLIDSPPDDARQFDSEALWPLIQPQLAHCAAAGKSILRVHGVDGEVVGAAGEDAAAAWAVAPQSHGRDWLGAAIRQTGVALHSVVAYLRQPPEWDARQEAAACELADMPAIWLFSSSRAVRQLARRWPDKNWGHATALATHPRIARQAQSLGFGHVFGARPAVGDVVQLLRSCP